MLATRSARAPGSSTFSTTTMTSGGSSLPSSASCVSWSRTVRISASISSGDLRRAAGSAMRSIRTAKNGSLADELAAAAPCAIPCTRILTRPSGSLSMRMIIATVPTGVDLLRQRDLPGRHPSAWQERSGGRGRGRHRPRRSIFRGRRKGAGSCRENNHVPHRQQWENFRDVQIFAFACSVQRTSGIAAGRNSPTLIS